MEPSLGGWWHNLRTEGNSNLQLVGQLFYLWGWEKIFGASEISLRASNIPFFAGGVCALAWGMSPSRYRQTALVLLALSNAFLWYYLSEARPYIVLFCFASITAACLFRLLQAKEDALESPLWFRLFCLGLCGLCLTSLIAVPWALGAMIAVLYWCGPRAFARSVIRFKASSFLFAVVMAALGLYYLWTLQIGARASGVGRTGWSSVAFIFYELLGLAGLGPGRLQLRAQHLNEMAAFAPFLALGGGAVLVLLLAGVSSVKEQMGKRQTVFFLFAVAGASLPYPGRRGFGTYAFARPPSHSAPPVSSRSPFNRPHELPDCDLSLEEDRRLGRARDSVPLRPRDPLRAAASQRRLSLCGCGCPPDAAGG